MDLLESLKRKFEGQLKTNEHRNLNVLYAHILFVRGYVHQEILGEVQSLLLKLMFTCKFTQNKDWKAGSDVGMEDVMCGVVNV